MSDKLFLFLITLLISLAMFASYAKGREDGAEKENEIWTDIFNAQKAVSEKNTKLYGEENYSIGYKHGTEQCK